MNMSPSSSRWSPTPEQLMMLEEIYRGGVRTPSASQIQRITAQLSLYGRIEGKNVFYWFQNHKARDRQKLRRKLLLTQQLIHHHHHQLLCHPAAPNYNHHFLPSSPVLRCHRDLQVGGGVNVEDTSTRGTNCKWKTRTLMDDKSSSLIINKTWNDDYWKINMMDECASPAPPHPPASCNNRPLKTLQLFPITSTTSTPATVPSPPPSPISSVTQSDL